MTLLIVVQAGSITQFPSCRGRSSGSSFTCTEVDRIAAGNQKLSGVDSILARRCKVDRGASPLFEPSTKRYVNRCIGSLSAIVRYVVALSVALGW